MPDIRLNPTVLSQYIKFSNCERFLRFSLCRHDADEYLEKWGITEQPLTPLLSESGIDFESDVIQKIIPPGTQLVDLSENKDVSETLKILSSFSKPTLLYQAYLNTPLGSYPCGGQTDIIHLNRDKDKNIIAHISDIKSTFTEKTEHRVQVALYSKMLEDLCSSAHLPLKKINVSITTKSKDGSYPYLEPSKSTFDLSPYYEVIKNLVISPSSVVHHVLNTPIEKLFYHLSYKCDGCYFNSLCMFYTAEKLDLCLVPYITPVEKRTLLAHNITSARDLADLMAFSSSDPNKLVIPPDKAYIVSQLQSNWPIGPNLPILIQRAKAALHHQDKSMGYHGYLVNSNFGVLPDDTKYPDLIKIFFDVQRDYLRDRLYLLSALVVGPKGSKTIVNFSNTPPGDSEEEQLLLDWVSGILSAVNSLSSSSSAPIHFYCYDRYDQKDLLNALKRNIDSLSQIPAFFDLLTQTPALTQSIISFLNDEIRDRRNLGHICNPLHSSVPFDFDWNEKSYPFYNIFRARLFDNTRGVTRDSFGNISRAPSGSPDRFNIESASRFNSQIPLEYAYSCWGILPTNKKHSKALEFFRNPDINRDSLIAFAEKRVSALSAIEASIKKKNDRIEKIPIPISSLLIPDEDLSFSRSLTEFLFIEHHITLQTNLINYSLPIEQRVQNGQSLLLECSFVMGDSATFRLLFSEIGLDPTLAFNANKLKEGDWVVLNKTSPPPYPNQIKNGRIAIITSLDSQNITLSLLDVRFPNSTFRYYHDVFDPLPGSKYSIDTMSDDLNADKMIEALDHSTNNVFYQWLLKKPSDYFAPNLPSFYEKFSSFVFEMLRSSMRKLTAPQLAAINSLSSSPLFLVQGPPGTGKSYTLAWVVLSRIAAAASRGASCRVLISCKTHNAILVALRALVDSRNRIKGFAPPELGGNVFPSLSIYKVVAEDSDNPPSGVLPLKPYSDPNLSSILQGKTYIIGATSGQAYTLMKKASGKKVDWSSKPFDLVVIDEASQMSLPEGVLAGAFLRPGGSMIVVGDHRQMPPIIAHPWEDEQKRTVSDTLPYISLFESLAARDFPCIRLDESFRLHSVLAEFLRQNIYSKDGIPFHSKRSELIPQLPHISEFVDNVLNPSYPIIVVEHEEISSQQFNPLEVELARPLISACVENLSLDGRNGIGIVVPHRAQKALLRTNFPVLADVNSIDTVERFQGDERDVIIVSATASDPDYVLSEADFLFNLNRLNVAISRPRKKLIVIASSSVINLLVSDLEVFDQSVIWKRLFRSYTPELLFSGYLSGYHFTVRGCKSN